MRNHIITIKLDSDTFYALVEQASQRGIYPSRLAEHYVEASLEADATDPTSPAVVKLYGLNRKVIHEQENHDTLVRIASWLLVRPDEQAIDTLASLCESMGWTMQEIMEDAAVTSPEMLISLDQSSDATSIAMQFLLDVIQPGTECPAKVIEHEAEQKGISAYALRAAKKRLKVISQQRGRYWTWRLPEEARGYAVDLRMLDASVEEVKEDAIKDIGE